MFIVLIGLISPLGSIKSADPTELILTWKANTYIPLDYLGKALPVPGARIDFGLQMVDENKLINLFDNEIRWYVNNNLISSGSGLTNFSYVPPLINGDSLSIRVVVRNYKEAEINSVAELLLVKPEAVVDPAQLPQFKPLFYYFNVSSPDQIETSWSQTANSVDLRAQSLTNPLEFAETTLLLSPQ